MTAKRANLFGNVARMSATPPAPRALQCHAAFAPQRGHTQAKTDPRHRGGHKGSGATWAFLAVRGQKKRPTKKTRFFRPNRIWTDQNGTWRCFARFLGVLSVFGGLTGSRTSPWRAVGVPGGP
jgi:hypothetical protein